MMKHKPIINLDELTYQDTDTHDRFSSSYAVVSHFIGAKELGYNVSKVLPGKMVCPFHNHRNAEEMFFILEGSGKLRFGKDTHAIRQGDFIACPPGGPEVAHQIINDAEVPLVYLALSNLPFSDVCEYPDSKKVGVYVGRNRSKRDLRRIYKIDDTVDYFEGEG